MIVILRLTPQSRACCPPGGRRRTLALLIGIALFTVSGHALADYAAGAAFYAKKDYEHAFAVLLPAAQEGEAEAQFTMGVIDVGQHVQVDKQAAFGWFRRAADQGHPNGQIRLSGMLFAGEGVSPDRQEAYKWALLAIDRLPLKKRDAARAFSRQIRPLLDDAQAAHAQAEAAVWQPRLPAMADHDGATPRLIKTGTGVFMNDRGSLLTDLHVAWPCWRLLVSYGDATNEATIFTFDIALDLAVLDTAFRRVQTAVFAVAPSLLVGESVSIIGYALQETSSRAPISAQGTITALGLFGNEDFFWTSAGSRQGQSGGPVIDERGLVVGLLKGSSKTQDPAIEASSSTQNRSLAIAGERIAGFLERSKIAFRKSTSDGAIGETHSTASRAGIIGLVECWG